MSNVRANSVIACIDGSEYTHAVLDASLWIAKKLHAPLGLMHAHDPQKQKQTLDYSGNIGFGSSEQLLESLTDADAKTSKQKFTHGHHLLADAIAYLNDDTHVQDKNTPEVYKLHRHQSLKDSIAHVNDHADMIVLGQMGDHDHNKDHVGGQLEAAIRTATCPIFITRTNFQLPKTALFAFDNKTASKKVLEWLSHSALCRHMKIHVVMVADDNATNQEALRAAYAKLKQGGLEVSHALIKGKKPANTILNYQKQHELDMIIMGAFGHSRLYELFKGSNTHELLNKNAKQVLLLPHH